ncbi:hypothetical protein TTHERM_00773530 (macronuclear) [Tetrahymena thermophila SB210]|uniref:DUF4485 domain-containing protein n=1 Tax=Tetrahymena thermophila (strain SB210) TaxID=312017 RepID=I7MFH1_TETTS|nr:hypothetical protein TTHERM_00773530 [Tetrahymena thermophila SB210]EAR83943.2 hypothetical protein TTHERM_00773530 [Tetrahymena thermophila SB210]|eukprot:XP_001031606.2 hypothetical protein TTHERM_00773530 [Tetrahymena thermophila SB210]
MNRNNRSNSPFGQHRSIQGGGSKDITPSPIKPKDIQENQQLDDEFVNVMLEVEQKYTILSKHERIRIEQWTKKLCTVTTNKIWKKNRNLYAKELLSMVIASKLREPFTRMPPDGPLPKFNKYDIEKPKKSDPFLIREDMNLGILDQRQRSINSHHVNYNHQNLPLNNSQHRSHSNLHSNYQQQQVNTPQQNPQNQQQQFQYYGTASFNQNEHNNIQQSLAQQNQNEQNMYIQNQNNEAYAGNNQLNKESVKRASRSNSLSKKVYDDNLIIQQQAEQIKQLQVQLQITESKYTNHVQSYQEDIKNLEQQYKNQINEIQQIFNQQNQTLNQKIDENNQLQQQVKKLRNILSNIGIQIIHIKDTLPQQQSQQLDEIVKQLSGLNSDNSNLNGKEQSDLNVPFSYLNDTNENYASPQSNIYNDGTSHHLAQPINNSIVSKQQMSPNVRSKHQSSNMENSLMQNSISNNILGPTKQQTPTNNQQNSAIQYEGNLTNRSKTSNQNHQNQVQNQLGSNLSNDKGSSYNILSSRTSSRPNALPSNKNSFNPANRYFPSMNNQRSNLNNQQDIQNDTPAQIYPNQQQVQQDQIQQNQNIQAQPISQFQNHGITINTTSQQGQPPQISTRYEKSPNQQHNKYADPMPITLKNEQETQEFLNYLDNFQKRTEKLKNETSQYLKVNEKYIQPQKK